MISTQGGFNIHSYIDMFLRQIWYIIIPFVLVSAITTGYILFAPKEYKATTLVLVVPQKIPESFVRPSTVSTIQDRLQNISQETLSRTRLEQVISEFNLYPEETKSLPMEKVVEMLRGKIELNINTVRAARNQENAGGSFNLSYSGSNPVLVAKVTNKLSSMFIEENLRVREQQAQGTVEFLNSELQSTKKKMDDQEKLLTEFKRRHLNELPEQREANLRAVDQLQTSYQRIGEALKSAEDRKIMIQNKLADIETHGASSIYIDTSRDGRTPSSPAQAVLASPEQQLNQLKASLAELQTKYTDNHPDIVTTKKKVADLENKIKINLSKKEKGEKSEDSLTRFHFESLKGELIPIELEIKRLRKEETSIKSGIAEYRARAEKSPFREIDLGQITQQYNQTKESYQTLLKKQEEAQQAENLERRQKGEQFRVIDPAKPPVTPFKPNILMILPIGLILALGSGLGLAFLREMMDRSFRDPDDVEATLGLKVLANIPRIEQEGLEQRA
jgi:polysaccharide chain length determinant protein (PEP-CTERM system associated)